MRAHLWRSLVASALFFLVLGLGYPALETVLGQVLFSHQANGSLGANGSTLIGQNWTGPRWFHGRPEPRGNNPMASGAANLGPRSEILVHDVATQIAALERAGITPTAGLVTSSGSGIDPDIAPADAYAQVRAVATARHLPVALVRRVVAAHVHGAELGFLGAPYVDVLALNEAVARLR